MSSPEKLPDWGWDEVTTTEDYSVRTLFIELFQEYQEVFDELREGLERVELLGEDDFTRRSYHQGPNREGGQVRLFYENRIEKGIGRYSRIWANYETILPNGGTRLELYYFAYKRDANALVLNYGQMKIDPGMSMFSGAAELNAPLLFMRDGEVKRTHSPNYKFAEPFDGSLQDLSDEEVYDFALDHIANAQFLTELFSLLSGDSKQDVKW